jgi:hypothetical protein
MINRRSRLWSKNIFCTFVMHLLHWSPFSYVYKHKYEVARETLQCTVVHN